MATERAAGATDDAAARARWSAVRRVSSAALDLPPDARAAFLDEVCGGDAELRDEAGRLVRACERAERSDGFLAGVASAYAAPVIADVRADAAAIRASIPETLRAALAGRYDVGPEIGRGGMATVFLADDVRHRRAVA